MSRYEPLLEYNNINGIEQWKINDISVSKERYEEAVKKQNKRINDITPDEWNGMSWAGSGGGEAGATRASSKQVGGNHYKQFKIQPAEFCYWNNIPYLEATAIKYLCRWKDKGGIQDLEKAKHFIDLLIEFENANH